jgi:hypothetical protein
VGRSAKKNVASTALSVVPSADTLAPPTTTIKKVFSYFSSFRTSVLATVHTSSSPHAGTGVEGEVGVGRGRRGRSGAETGGGSHPRWRGAECFGTVRGWRGGVVTGGGGVKDGKGEKENAGQVVKQEFVLVVALGGKCVRRQPRHGRGGRREL